MIIMPILQKMLQVVKYQTKAFTLLESLLTLGVTCFLLLCLSGTVSRTFQKVEETLFFLSFENFYRDTQKLSITKQKSMSLGLSSEKVSNGIGELHLPKTVDFSGQQTVKFDQAGGNSSLSKVTFKTSEKEVVYQLYLGSGNYKKISISLHSP